MGIYRYVGQVSLPVLPAPDTSQRENPQAVHIMIQLWDGRNALFASNGSTLEGTIYWELNPWAADYGNIKIYTGPLDLVDTGITLTPDLDWHTFELVVDLANQRYVSVRMDGETRDMGSYELAQVSHPEWGSDVSLNITTESMAAWPHSNCAYVFVWTTRFRDLAFQVLPN